MWVYVENGEIKKIELPRVGTLSDGRTVSGYHMLPEETLRAEGWLPVEDNPPAYDPATHYIVVEGYEVLSDRVTKVYRVEAKPSAEQPVPDEYEQRLTDIEMALAAIMGGTV